MISEMMIKWWLRERSLFFQTWSCWSTLAPLTKIRNIRFLIIYHLIKLSHYFYQLSHYFSIRYFATSWWPPIQAFNNKDLWNYDILIKWDHTIIKIFEILSKNEINHLSSYTWSDKFTSLPNSSTHLLTSAKSPLNHNIFFG